MLVDVLFYMIIRNDASNLFFFAYLAACLPVGREDR
jgi:hypothetical protein